jgi:hypothetical protein
MRLRELSLEAGGGSPQKPGWTKRDRAAPPGQRGMHRGIRVGIGGKMECDFVGERGEPAR